MEEKPKTAMLRQQTLKDTEAKLSSPWSRMVSYCIGHTTAVGAHEQTNINHLLDEKSEIERKMSDDERSDGDGRKREA